MSRFITDTRQYVTCSACWQPPSRGRGASARPFAPGVGQTRRDIKPDRPSLLAEQEVVSSAVPLPKKAELYEVLDLGPRNCQICGKNKAAIEFYREPAEPFKVKKICRKCTIGIHTYPSDNIPETDIIRKQKQRIARLEEDYKHTNGQARFDNLMQLLQQAARSSRDDSAYESALQLQNPDVFEERIQGVQEMLLLNRGDAILLIREQAELLLLPADLLAERVVELKSVVPKADIARLLQLGPWLLLLDDIAAQLEPVLRQLQALMPSFDVHQKLHDGSGVWWSAADLLKSKKRSFSYSANNPPDPKETADELEDIKAEVGKRAEKFETEIDHAFQYGGLNI